MVLSWYACRSRNVNRNQRDVSYFYKKKKKRDSQAA